MKLNPQLNIIYLVPTYIKYLYMILGIEHTGMMHVGRSFKNVIIPRQSSLDFDVLSKMIYETEMII